MYQQLRWELSNTVRAGPGIVKGKCATAFRVYGRTGRYNPLVARKHGWGNQAIATRGCSRHDYSYGGYRLA